MAEKVKFSLGNHVRIKHDKPTWIDKFNTEVNFFDCTGEIVTVWDTHLNQDGVEVDWYGVKFDYLDYIKTYAGMWLELIPNPLIEWWLND